MILHTVRATLRPWHPDDAPALASVANDIRIWRTVRDRFPHPYTLADAELFIALQLAAERATNLAIVVDGQVAGGIGWIPGSDVNRLSAELGYWLGPAYWGRGIAREAVSTLTQALFTGDAPFHRLFAIVAAGNTASARVLEATGFRHEGTLRESAIKEGVLRDELVYGRLRTDPDPSPIHST